ncbi:unnamed protein product [Commensalibacter communis]|uniref:hypothetical protein n=1 Tax=Commensalibacter communis TaxID=2972786 RepID=UPI0022FF9120|nr:hypothetical protein [Commensalibacter communis]CAI3949295.1 unnamed protein product [Commensalibacter communis]
MNLPFPIHTTGRVLNGEDKGAFIKIIVNEDDSFSILLTPDPTNPRIGFDDWVQDRYALIEYFKETGWIIEWLDHDHFSNP